MSALLSALTISTLCIGVSASATNQEVHINEDIMSYDANTADTQWYANNNYCRPKYNASSIYVKNVSMQYSAYVDVYGNEFPNGHDYYVSINGHNATNVSLPPNREGEIYQGIHEHTNPILNYAHVYFRNPSGSTGTASGVWSPDCSGSYSPLN
jgi:hypothetical protein